MGVNAYPWLTIIKGGEMTYSSTELRKGGYQNAHKFTVADSVEYLKKYKLLQKCRCGARWKLDKICTCNENE